MKGVVPVGLLKARHLNASPVHTGAVNRVDTEPAPGFVWSGLTMMPYELLPIVT